MEKLIFDTHTHYTQNRFDGNRAQLLGSLPGKGVAAVVECATDYTTAKAAVALARQYDYVFAALGIHPQSLIEEEASTRREFAGDWRAELAAIAPLYEEEGVVAVGEVGLDHHWPVPREEQLLLFEEELKVALERDLPVLVHDREAHEETYRLLKKYKPRGVMHAYAGSAEDVKWICAQGMYISFTGKVTFPGSRRALQAAAAVPQEYLLMETDCPYMAPVPFRGKDSDSTMIPYTAAPIARERGVEVEDLLRAARENARRLFRVCASSSLARGEEGAPF